MMWLWTGKRPCHRQVKSSSIKACYSWCVIVGSALDWSGVTLDAALHCQRLQGVHVASPTVVLHRTSRQNFMAMSGSGLINKRKKILIIRSIRGWSRMNLIDQAECGSSGSSWRCWRPQAPTRSPTVITWCSAVPAAVGSMHILLILEWPLKCPCRERKKKVLINVHVRYSKDVRGQQLCSSSVWNSWFSSSATWIKLLKFCNHAHYFECLKEWQLNFSSYKVHLVSSHREFFPPTVAFASSSCFQLPLNYLFKRSEKSVEEI